ncbi:PEGA domain-containing protein [Patescibacteria group bacterium]|nr:PEGA domain-containing protein [Patescibacteria group bacterium]
MKKIYISIFTLILVFILSVIIFTTLRTGDLNVTSSPSGAQFILNKKVYYTPAEIKNLPVGKYLITVHNDGYKDEQHNVEIKSLSRTSLNLDMQTQSKEESILEEEKTWLPYFNNQEKTIKESVSEREIKNPLTKFLPFSTGSIIFDYEVDKNNSVSYFVTGLPNKSYVKSDYEKSVKDFILSKGIDPNSITISWR